MFAKKSLPIGTLLIVIVIALAGMGVAYGHWTATLTDVGTVNTGTFVADWFNVFTDDDGTVVDATKDDGDDGNCAIGGSSCDPLEPGPNPNRETKGIGHCTSWIVDTEDYLILHWNVDNAYPSYYCTVWGHIRNMGSIPMKIQTRSLTADPGITTGFIGGAHAFACGDQLDASDLLQVGMWIHVEQSAEPDQSYSGSSTYTLVNWNEWDAGACSGW